MTQSHKNPKRCVLFLIVKKQQNAANKTRHNRSQFTLLVGCQLLHVSAARCHHQAEYQQQSFVVPTPSLPQAKLQAQTVQTPDRRPTNTSAAATPHSDRPPLLHVRSTLYFLSRAHKYPYQYLIQRDLLRRKLTTYPVPGYSVHCNTLHFTVYPSCLATRFSSCHISIQGQEQEQNILEGRT